MALVSLFKPGTSFYHYCHGVEIHAHNLRNRGASLHSKKTAPSGAVWDFSSLAGREIVAIFALAMTAVLCFSQAFGISGAFRKTAWSFNYDRQIAVVRGSSYAGDVGADFVRIVEWSEAEGGQYGLQNRSARPTAVR